MHSITWIQEILTFMSQMGECRQQKHIQYAPSMKMECDYLYGWNQNSHICKNLTKNGETQKYSWERRRNIITTTRSSLKARSNDNSLLYGEGRWFMVWWRQMVYGMVEADGLWYGGGRLFIVWWKQIVYGMVEADGLWYAGGRWFIVWWRQMVYCMVAEDGLLYD